MSHVFVARESSGETVSNVSQMKGSEQRTPGRTLAVVGGMIALLSILLADGVFTFRAETGRSAIVCFGLVLFILGTGAEVLRGRLALVPSPAAWGLAILVLWGMLSMLWGEPGPLGVFQGTKYVLLTLAMVCISAWPSAWVVKWSGRILACGLLLLGVIWGLGVALNWERWNFGRPLRLQFGHPNLLGSAVVFSALWVWGTCVNGSDRMWRWVGLPALAVAAGLALATDSRGAILVGLAGGTVFVLATARWGEARKWSVSLGRAALFLAVGALTVKAASTSRFGTKVVETLSGVSASDQERWQIFRLAWEAATETPATNALGHGFGHFYRVSLGWNPRDFGRVGSDRYVADFAHSEYLDWWLDCGVVGLVLWLGVWGLTVRRLAKTAFSSPGGPDARLATTSLAIVFTWLALGAADLSTRYIGPQAIAWLVLGLAWSEVARPARLSLGSRLWVWGALFAPVVWAAGIAPLMMSEIWTRRAYASMTSGDAPGSVEAGRKAVTWKADHAEALYLLLRRSAERGDFAEGRASMEALERAAPGFADSARWWATLLIAKGEYATAAGVLRSYQMAAPYDFEAYLDLPMAALAAGDRNLLEECMADLLVYVIETSNDREKSRHRTSVVSFGDGRALLIEPGDGSPTLTLPYRGLPGLIWGRKPASFDEARRLAIAGINRFLATELKAGTPLLEE